MPKKKSVKSPGLPKELTVVTPLSKGLAFIVFIVLPIAAFLIGIRYQQWFDVNQTQIQNANPVIMPIQLHMDVQNVTPPPSCYFGSSCINGSTTDCHKVLMCPQGGQMVPYKVLQQMPKGY